MENTVITMLIGMLGAFGILFLGFFAYIIIAQWKLFEKAGKPGWASIVPVYNAIVMLEIIGYKWYYIFLFFASIVPFVGYIVVLLFTITYSIKLAKSFGQEVGFGIGLLFVSPVFIGIIAFSKKIKYVGPAVKGDIDFNDLF